MAQTIGNIFFKALCKVHKDIGELVVKLHKGIETPVNNSSDFGQATIGAECKACGRTITVPHGEPFLCHICEEKQDETN